MRRALGLAAIAVTVGLLFGCATSAAKARVKAPQVPMVVRTEADSDDSWWTTKQVTIGTSVYRCITWGGGGQDNSRALWCEPRGIK